MAIVDQHPTGVTDANPYVYEVTLRLVIEPPVTDRDKLLDFASLVDDAIDEHTSERVLGASVSGTYEPCALEISMGIAAGKTSELVAELGDVVSILERECGAEIIGVDTHIERAAPEPELACA